MINNSINQQIFIGGCSRSGTTLLGAMIGGHTNCICSPESHFKIDVLRALARETIPPTPAAMLALTKRHWRFKIWELELEAPTTFDTQTETPYADLLGWIVTQYAHQQNKPDAHIWVDHTPENLGYASSLMQLYPHAKMIHIVRDGRAVAASIMPLDWGPNSIIKAARWWMRLTSFGLAAETTFGPECVMRVKYEDIVLEPEATMRAICTFLNIDFQPEMLQATGFNPPSYTTKQHKLVGSRPNPSVVTRWEQKLTHRQVEIFENLTRDFLFYLGYPLRYGLKAKGPSIVEIQLGKVNELFRGEILNKFKWLKRSYPLWLSRDFYSQAGISDKNN